MHEKSYPCLGDSADGMVCFVCKHKQFSDDSNSIIIPLVGFGLYQLLLVLLLKENITHCYIYPYIKHLHLTALNLMHVYI